MKIATNRRTILILLFVVLFLTLNFVVAARELLFDEVSVKGETRVHIKIGSNMSTDDIIDTIAQVSQQPIRDIKIDQSTAASRNITIRIGYIDAAKTEYLINRLQQQYSNDIEVQGSESITGFISMETRYKLFAILGTAVAAIIVLIVLYITSIVKQKKGLSE